MGKIAETRKPSLDEPDPPSPPPTVTSILHAGTEPPTAPSVDFVATFSQPVTGVDISDFALTTTEGISGASIASVSGSDTTYTVSVNTGSGNGTIRLDVIDDDTIIDNLNMPLGGVGIGNGDFTVGEVFIVDKNVMLVVDSNATYDGWILESTETSGTGGSINSAHTVFRVGDDAQNRQYRSILSFGTAGLPDNAVIVSAQLKIKKQSLTGTDPFTTHNSLVADIRHPRFGSAYALELEDFNSTAEMNNAGVIGSTPVDGFYVANLKTAALSYINISGPMQFRLRFQLDDDNDSSADYLQFYSGDQANEALHPVLVITYYIP